MESKDIKYPTWDEFELWEHVVNKHYTVEGGYGLCIVPEAVHTLLATIRALCELSVQEAPCALCAGTGVLTYTSDKRLDSHYQHPPSDVQYKGCPSCGGNKKKYKTPADVLIAIADLHAICNLEKENKNDS